ncbi:phage tail sheath C-terminal domain-containing protein [Moorena sp. SIO4G3]|uniref:phage tail sheath family protein n=1 Tax=Moorena sp. SIO4G3 TaxID=2607821 RepID=UPI00142A5418|nr:phage tail sheath C-terminal domain-containing protein [Moorena sp. SIO4G3]NEO78348.1 phage tail sheath family protein [Moorena sp. SIO4G3]
MPVTPTYPGVYIEEIPSGVRTITGVATSITAFIGRAFRGPTDEPILINNYGEYERIFGGLWNHSTMSFAVRDFYTNGGSQAVIVRLHKGGTEAELNAGSGSPLALKAANVGVWGNKLRARVDTTFPKSITDQGTHTAEKLFNLYIRDGETEEVETFLKVSAKFGHPRQVDKVLENQSNLVRYSGTITADIPVPTPNNDPSDGNDLWSDASSNKVESANQGSDGDAIAQNEFTGTGKEGEKKGLYALENTDLFNLLCIPPYKNDNKDIDSGLIDLALGYCLKRRAMMIIDSPSSWTDKDKAKTGIDESSQVGSVSTNGAIFFPRLRMPNPLRENQMETFAACGAIAGIFARTDASRGVWKAPAGLEAVLKGVTGLSVPLTDPENGELNPKGINCLRVMPPAGRIVWGSRTREGDDMLASEWKYIPVRRLALYLEETLYRNTQWAVFEPNDEPLWSQLRLNIGAFMQNLFKQGAFQGSSPKDAYFVKCDKETTTQYDIDRGIVNIMIGFAPLKPAEFVILKFQQIAGQS